MFITPIQRLDGIALPQSDVISNAGQGPIGAIFKDVLQNVIDTDNAVATDMQSLASGEADDLHSLAINQTKAQLSIQLLVQIRNKLMESYSEVMRVNL